MRVRVRDSALTNRPPDLDAEEPIDQLFLTERREYDVHALSVFDGTVSLQIIDDLEYPAWRSAWYFEVVNPSIPRDWVCSVFNDRLSLLLGPEFVARDYASYEAMVLLEPNSVDAFWTRVKRVEKANIESDLVKAIEQSPDNWISANKRQDMMDLVSAEEPGLAFEGYCTQLYEHDAVVPNDLFERLRRIGQYLDVHQHYWNRLTILPK